MKKVLRKIILIVIFLILGILIQKNVEAAYIGNVDSLDETKYPGFKEKIKMVQAVYPNIQILYTGLDWNEVIYNETVAPHGRNLVSKDSKEEWICKECKDSGKVYDSGLYCASKEAVEYMMDPRNFLTPRDIFQFQKLDTVVGNSVDEVRKVLQYQNATYLMNDEDAIAAFAQVASKNSLNTYHLITRVIQEQGRSGTSILSSGLGYTGNGYQNYGYGYYNLFSIGATKGSSDPSYKIYLNALDRAAIEGWNTRAKSISGGGNFVGEKYINVGQNTLYLQKFAVYNTNGNLYWHQYMQNLFGTQSEASILYKSYQATGIQNNANFQFLIPVYENMPSNPSPEPGEKYDGYMTSYEYGDLVIEKNNIIGNIIVQEWINGTTQAQPRKLPKVFLKAKDNTEVECNVTYVEPYVYKFSVDISLIDITKDYYIEVRCGSSNNISNHTIVQIEFTKNQTIGVINNYNAYLTNSLLNFTYNVYMTNGPYSAIELRGNILSGDLIVQEWINGTKQEQPKVNPKVVLKDEDGNEIKCTVTYKEPYVYHYEIDLAKVDRTKKYEIEVQSGTDKNISDHTKVKVIYEDQKIGIYDNIYVVKMKDSKLSFTYDGYMTNGPYSEITLKGTTMTGRLIIQEWIDGTKQVEPTSLPKIVLKGTSGGQIEGSLKYIEPYVYEYQFDISKLSKEESYEMEVQCTNKDNISDHKDVVVNYSDRTIGKIDNYNLIIEENKFLLETK